MKWNLKPTPEIPAELKSFSLNPVTLKLLCQRGFFSKGEIEKFLATKYENLHSPEDLAGISQAVEKISAVLKKNGKIAIYGDYDADGITSTALLKEALEEINPKIPISTYIPDRNKEGYGLNEKALDFIKKEHNPDLLITVDCGISNHAEVAYARKLGFEVIISDHHSIPKKLPKKCVLINPKLPDQNYPFRELAGVGVAFKLAEALWQKNIPDKVPHLKWFLDLVAIGTIADCVPLVDENRIFAKFGLIVLQKTKRIGIQEMIKTARLKIDEKNPPNAENVAFQIGPRFNAAGRMDHADLTLNLLTEKDRVKARLMALEVESKNTERQKVTAEVLGEIQATLKKSEEYRLIIRKGKHWPLGILGVVAGKIADEYHCPVFILRETDGLLEGSGRSIDVFDLIAGVGQLENLLEKYGGHSQAMGLKMKPKNLAKFEECLLDIIKKSYNEAAWGEKISVDAELPTKNIDWDIIAEMKRFEPFGEGNREPVFLSRDLIIENVRLVGNGQKHIKFLFKTRENNPKNFEGIFWKSADRFDGLKPGERVAAIFNLRSNEWNGNNKIELNIIDIEPIK